ncbi:MAG: 2-succinyl-5-enolpyruvyl-6-hydroxy-3-cyclohexene-1-carboxylic-acid synthase [Actinomycetes bacterium]
MESDLFSERLAGRPSEDVQATFCAVLVDEWVRQGIRHVVIAPGSRSTPLALALTNRSEMHIEVFHDERSAAFAALGVGLATHQPAILLCTSGTAAAHFYAAIIEADLSHVPMLVVTADRPPELKDVGAPQTIDQTKMYGDTVRWFHDPGVADVAANDSWRSLARQSFAASQGVSPGPVHLNLPFREPLVGTAVELPLSPFIRNQFIGRLELSPADYEGVATILNAQQGLIIAGRGCGSAEEVSRLASLLQWPVLADSRSGCQGIPEAVPYFDAVVRCEKFVVANQPKVVLRLGESPSSKVLSQFVTKSQATQVHVSAFESTADADHRMSLHISCDPSVFCRELERRVKPNRDSGFLVKWLGANRAAGTTIEKYFGDADLNLLAPRVAQLVAQSLKEENNLVVSSSMPVRDLEWFGGDCSRINVFSNRGANGIDGVLATAIGVAIATRRKTAVLIGDIALLHDSSSLTDLNRRNVDLKIVVTDNDGGGIFHYLPQAKSVNAEAFEMLFGTPHGTDILQLAKAHHLSTYDCQSASELKNALASPETCVIRVLTDRKNEVLTHQEVNDLVAAAINGNQTI